MVNFYTLTPSGTEKEKLSLGKSQQLIRTAGNEIRSTCISMENVAPLAHTTQGTPLPLQRDLSSSSFSTVTNTRGWKTIKGKTAYLFTV